MSSPVAYIRAEGKLHSDRTQWKGKPFKVLDKQFNYLFVK